MSWAYKIAAHSLTPPNGALPFTEGLYSGAFGESQNNPECCSDVNQGPIPTGNWRATALLDDPKTGPDTIVLTPADAATLRAVTESGRDPFSFRIHGDDIADPGHGSEGCIVAPRDVRMAIWNSDDHSLQVTA